MVDLKEQANLVLEVETLLHWRRNANENNKRKLLIVYDQDLSEEVAANVEWEGKLKVIEKGVRQVDNRVKKVLEMKDDFMLAINDIRDQLSKLNQKKAKVNK